MDTYEDIVKRHHRQCLLDMSLQLSAKMQSLMLQKQEKQNMLDRIQLAVEGAGYPDISKRIDCSSYNEHGIVDTAVNAMRELKKIDDEIDVLRHTFEFLKLDDNTEVLKG